MLVTSVSEQQSITELYYWTVCKLDFYKNVSFFQVKTVTVLKWLRKVAQPYLLKATSNWILKSIWESDSWKPRMGSMLALAVVWNQQELQFLRIWPSTKSLFLFLCVLLIIPFDLPGCGVSELQGSPLPVLSI